MFCIWDIKNNTIIILSFSIKCTNEVFYIVYKAQRFECFIILHLAFSCSVTIKLAMGFILSVTVNVIYSYLFDLACVFAHYQGHL